jgi:hypothetical protein
MSAVHAFARRVDDIGDGYLDPAAQLGSLAAERRIVAIAGGDVDRTNDSVAIALARGHRHYGLPLDALDVLIDGVELDVTAARHETFDELVVYCRHVAGSIVRLCLAIFTDGTESARGRVWAMSGIYRRILERIYRDPHVVLRGRISLPAWEKVWALHLATPLARYRPLGLRGRMGAARGARALGRVDPEDPVADARSGEWLRQHRQGADAIETLWGPLIRATLNLDPAVASLAQVAQLPQAGLLGNAADGDVGYTRLPLSDIHDRSARATLAQAGVDVRLRRGAVAISAGRGGFYVELNAAPSLEGDAVILAVPPDRAAGLMPSSAGVSRSTVARLGRSPIVNLHVVIDRPVLDVPFAAGIHPPVQWLFDRTASSGLQSGQYLAVSPVGGGRGTDDERRRSARPLPSCAARAADGHGRWFGRGVLRHPRARGHVPRHPRRPRPAPGSPHRAAGIRVGRKLDRHRLARHDGRHRPHWPHCCTRGALRAEK